MKSTPLTLSVDTAERIKEELIDRMVREAGRAPSSKVDHRIVRAEIRVPPMDTLAWLRAQDATSRGFWSDRERRFELAGIGRADVLAGDTATDGARLLNMLHQRIGTACGEVRYFGGMCFAPARDEGPEWASFGAYRFVLPRFELLRCDGDSILAVNMMAGEPLETVRGDLAGLRFPSPDRVAAGPAPRERADTPDREAWLAMVARTLGKLDAGGLEKVVLSRRATLSFDTSLDPAAWLADLRQRTPACFHFCFQPRRGHAFFGASPERLYRRDGRDVLTEAIAGTTPRLQEDDEDRRLAEAMMYSDKERREHAYVVDAIRGALAPLCTHLTSDPQPDILRLTSCQHLVTRFHGHLRDDATDAALLNGLHPTPAVGGWPTDKAVRHIQRYETFDRGWFAGPVGWVARDAAQFVVGIRSGLVEDRRLHLYAGAGIVEASDPSAEWAETEQKMGDLLDLFA